MTDAYNLFRQEFLRHLRIKNYKLFLSAFQIVKEQISLEIKAKIVLALDSQILFDRNEVRLPRNLIFLNVKHIRKNASIKSALLISSKLCEHSTDVELR
ncbi:hypothetical protein, partial [Oceanisphaera ostreae]